MVSSPLCRCPGAIVLAVAAGIPALLAARPATGGASPGAPPAARRPDPPPLVLEETPEVLRPVRPRTEAEEDRLHALALFTTARTLERQNQSARALRRYQRASRYDPEAVTAARAAVSLACRLDRYAEAVRYAPRVTDYHPADPLLFRRMGIYLTEQGDWPQAAAMYQHAVTARQDAPPTAADVLLRTEWARICHLAGQPEQAADNFQWVLHALDHPDQYGVDDEVRRAVLNDAHTTYYLIGECFFQAGRLDEAKTAFQKANEAREDPGRLGYHLARIAAEEGHPQKALDLLQAYFDNKLATGGLGPCQLLAQLLDALDAQDELVPRLEKLHENDPENAPLAYFLAREYLRRDQTEPAEKLFRRLAESTSSVLAYRNLLEIYHKTNCPEALLDALAEAAAKTAALEPLGAEALAIAEDGHLLDRLIQLARKRLEADPKSFDYHHRLAVALLAVEAQRYDVAGEFYSLATEADPDQRGELLLGWGLALLIDERYGEAAAVFQRGIDQDALPEDNPVFHYYLAGALEMDGRTDEALAAARKAAAIQPDSPRFLARVAWILYHADRRDDAAAVYRQLIQQFDGQFDSAEARQIVREARLVLSNLHVLDGETDRAVEYLEEILDEFPDDIAALNDLGYLWADQNQHLNRALGMIQKAVDADPENAAYRDSLGWVLYRLGRTGEALRELEKAASQDPDPVILDHLGDARLAAGKPGAAREAWQQAVDAFRQQEDPEEADRVQKKIHQLDTGRQPDRPADAAMRRQPGSRSAPCPFPATVAHQLNA